ncbi:hypothetical protein PENTCL1PPCAC_28893, partial [Pristionchus entomophagus]
SIIGYFLYNFLWRINVYPGFNNMFATMDQRIGTWIHAPLLFMSVFHGFVLMFIAIDRLFAVVADNKHKKFGKHLFWVAITLSIALALAWTWKTFFRDVEF